jgi:hypothetical protein
LTIKEQICRIFGKDSPFKNSLHNGGNVELYISGTLIAQIFFSSGTGKGKTLWLTFLT